MKLLNTIALATKPPDYPEGISKELEDFLDCCFQINPKHRSNVHELLAHPFILRKKLNPKTRKPNPYGQYKNRGLGVIKEQLSQKSAAAYGHSPFGQSHTSTRSVFTWNPATTKVYSNESKKNSPVTYKIDSTS